MGLLKWFYWLIRRWVNTLFLNLSPKLFISWKWKRVFGYSINWDQPRDINEKIQWLLINSDTSEWTRQADKCKVRDYVKEKGLGHLLVPLYGVWSNTKQIPFDELPDKFVLKCNHDFGSTILVDKNNVNYNQRDICNRLNRCLQRDFGINGELHYRGIPPRVIAEELLETTETEKAFSSSLIDYKVWCFDGKPYWIQVCKDRTSGSFSTIIYDLKWGKHPEYIIPTKKVKIAEQTIPEPGCLSEMLQAASILSQGFPEVRVDFYIVNGQLFFGEMTFTTSGGMIICYSQEFLKMLGDKVALPA